MPPRPPPADVHHQLDIELGGRPIVQRDDGRVGLVVLPVGYRLQANVPRTRADCPPAQGLEGGRLCPHYHCQHNLWLLSGDDRPGRRWRAGELPPETAQVGLPGVEQRGPRQEDSEGENTLSLYTEDNCCLDVLERHGGNAMQHQQIAKALNMTERQVRRIVRRAMVKAHGKRKAEALLAEMKER